MIGTGQKKLTEESIIFSMRSIMQQNMHTYTSVVLINKDNKQLKCTNKTTTVRDHIHYYGSGRLAQLTSRNETANSLRIQAPLSKASSPHQGGAHGES